MDVRDRIANAESGTWRAVMELESHKYQIVVESSSTIVELAYRTLSLRTKHFFRYLFI